MGRKYIKIAFDATPSVGAGVCIIYEEGETTHYDFYTKSHSYGTDPTTYEMKNGINALKRFKRHFDQNAKVDIYCDNTTAIDSEDHPDTIILMRQIQQLEDYWECDIGVGHHETIGDGNLLIQAANALSRKNQEQGEDILKKLGAKPIRNKGH